MDTVAAAWRWWRGWRGRDAVLVLLLTALLLWGSYAESHPHNPADTVQFGHRPVPQPGAALLLVAVACLALAWRRRRPAAVLAVSAAAAVGYTALGLVNGSVLIAPAIALYALASRVSARRAAAAGLVSMAVLTAVTAARNPFGSVTGGAVDVIPFMIAAVTFAGIAVANRRAYVASIRDRAERDAQQRIDEERLRIARELHDIVAHTMATINVQAGTAAHVLPGRPEVAAEALAAITAVSKEGLRELRAILNVLRQADETDPTRPAPGTAQLATLIAGARRAGLATTLTVTGQPAPLPPAVDLAAYRIVQESLTNAIRHAGPATAAVSVSYRGGEVRIEVTDTGRGAGPPGAPGPAAGAPGGGNGAGHGLAGMRERAEAVGGTVEAGPRPGGGFRVAATLPVGPGG